MPYYSIMGHYEPFRFDLINLTQQYSVEILQCLNHRTKSYNKVKNTFPFFHLENTPFHSIFPPLK